MQFDLSFRGTISVDVEAAIPLAVQIEGPLKVTTRFQGEALESNGTSMTEITARPVREEGDCFEDEYGARIRRGSILHLRPRPWQARA